MSDGKCGVHHYANITQAKVNSMLEELKKHGYKVTGNNPWDIDTKSHGVKLRGTWDKAHSSLAVIVTAKGLLVPCSMIWDKIDPLIHNLSTVSEAEIA